MARSTPYVQGGVLHVDGHETVSVGSAGWWRWLDAQASTTVRITDVEPIYTARRENRGPTRYWYAHRRREGQLRKVYLGRSPDLTAERLQEAAELLADGSDAASFVGRRDAVAEVARQLHRSRVVVLVGPGGIGKSRLAAAAAHSRAPSYPDGVHIASVATVQDPDLLASTVARSLGLPDHGTAALVDVIGQRRMLIVLDGCERVAEAAAALVETVITRCPGLRVLATSRRPLPLARAVSWRVPPLDVPDKAVDAATVLGTGAGRLFRVRARLVDPGFVVTDDNAAAVARVCRRLDGVPLTLELAAARLGALSVETLADRLDEGVTALDIADHQRSSMIHDVVAWSYDQLDDAARVLFARLAVFAGTWDLAAAEAVCADADLPATTVVQLLAALVEVSLVHVAAGRYRMLDIVRQYAAELLCARGEQDDLRDRHAAFLLARAELADPMGYDRASERHRRDLDLDAENLRDALHRLVERGDNHAARRMGVALAQYWTAASAVREGRQRLAELLALPGDPPARLLVGAGLLAAVDGDYPAARSLLDHALPRCRQDDDQVAAANALYVAGLLAWWRRDYAGAGASAAEGERVGLIAGRPGLVGLNVWTRAQVAAASGDADAAWRLAERALRLCVDADHPLGVALALNLMGQVLLDRREFAAAQDLLERTLAECRTFTWPALELMTLMPLAWTALERGDLDGAESWSSQGLTLARERLGPSRLCQPLEAAALLAAARHRWTRCLRLAEGAAVLRDRHQIAPAPSERARLADARARARHALGPAMAAAAGAAGRAASVDAAFADALHGATPETEPDHVVADLLPPLTPRQSEVARLVTDGLSNKQLAARLHLAEATIERHLVNIFQTLGVRSRTQLATWVAGATR